MIKGHFVMEHLLDKKGFPYTPTTIYSNELYLIALEEVP